jgi:hypothetical protein
MELFIADTEVPQVQGLGDNLVRENDPAVSGIRSNDPLEVVQHVIRLCVIHYKRYTFPIQHYTQLTVPPGILIF